MLLDTTVLIDVLRGRPGVTSRLRALRAQGVRPSTSALNVDEVVRGLRPTETRALQALLDGLLVVPLGRREGESSGTWRREHAARGVTLHQADCLVAAAALSAGGRLATGNPKDFPMGELVVEHWPSGE